jgi:uncharacterized delta-60 repeat protein
LGALILLVPVFVVGVAGTAWAAAGDLDPTFGTGGKVTTDFIEGVDYAFAVAIQGDGNIVVAGVANSDFALARYNPDGALDPTFGTAGKVTTDFEGVDFAVATAVAIQGDGKIVAAGYLGASNYDFALARYNPDGTLDPTFGTGGEVTTDFFGGFDEAWAVAIQGEGHIVVAGYTYEGSNFDFALARYKPDGTLDPMFGTGGKVTTDFFGGDDYAFAVAIQGDGNIVAAGVANGDFALAGYNPDGALDPTFGTAGKVTTDFFGSEDDAHAVGIQGDGRIVAVGLAVNGDSGFGLARYKPDGTLDPTFGTGGKVITFFGGQDFATSVAIQQDGDIVAAGSDTSEHFALARYNPDGTLDPTFGTGGKVTTDFFGDYNVADAVAIQGDGKIVAAGISCCGPGIYDFALARYEGSGALTVAIDIKPGSATNPIKASSRGRIPVAILSDPSFDATTVDPATVCFGDAEAPDERVCTALHATPEDVNGDGLADLLLQFRTRDTGIDPGDAQACLSGTTFDGAAVQGCDSVIAM